MRIKKVLTISIALLLPAVVSALASDVIQETEVAASSQSSQANPQATDVQLQVTLVHPQPVQAKTQGPEPAPQATIAPVPVVEAKSPAVAAPLIEAKAPQAEVPMPVPPAQPQAVVVTPQVPEVKAPMTEVAPQAAAAKSEIPERRKEGAKEETAAPEVKAGPNLFAEAFYAPAGQKLENKITEIRGLPFVKAHSREQDSEYAVVTDFGGGVLKSRVVPGFKDPKEIDAYIKKNLLTAKFEGVEIRQLAIPNVKGGTSTLYWVGDKAFASPEEATEAIDSSKMRVESQGGNFLEAVHQAPVYIPEPEPVIEVKTPAQYKKEEELILKFTDQMGIGEKMYGVLQGDPCGTPITWQSFGETSWRLTNLAANHYDTQVGYWTNRLVFSGIRFPLHNIDPFIESTISMDSTDTSWTNNLQLYAGLEWRPLARNPWLLNFQPFGGIPILEWMRNYRFYIKYGERYNIKQEIANSQHYDLIWGVQCYYEWGTELPPLDEGRPEKFTDYIRQYVWGEYYGDYYVSKTGLNSEKSFNAFIANSTVTMGIKLPGIPLPHNYINDELVLMPYMRFEHVNNSKYSFWYQNQYFVAAGIRIMPFRTYRWKENEWLSKLAIFGEWDGIGGAQRVKQNGEVPNIPNYDLRFGVKFSSRRF